VALIDLSDAELGAIVRSSPLWKLLLEQEARKEDASAETPASGMQV